jgi:hypothetical protein
VAEAPPSEASLAEESVDEQREPEPEPLASGEIAAPGAASESAAEAAEEPHLPAEEDEDPDRTQTIIMPPIRPSDPGEQPR